MPSNLSRWLLAGALIFPLLAAAQTDLSLDIARPGPAPRQWAAFALEVSLTNEGDAPATGITVSVPQPAGTVYTGGSEYEATQGTFATSGPGAWAVGTLPAGATASLTISYYLRGATVPSHFAEVLTQNEPDADSTPGNGDAPLAREDDEAALDGDASTSEPDDGSAGEEDERLPDLIVRDLRLERIGPNSYYGTQVVYSFEVANVGTRAVPTWWEALARVFPEVEGFDPHTTPYGVSTSAPSLGAGSAKRLVDSIRLPNADRLVLRITADGRGEVVEADEDNNAARLVIGPEDRYDGVADLSLGMTRLSGEAAAVDDRVVVYNAGPDAATDVIVEPHHSAEGITTMVFRGDAPPEVDAGVYEGAGVYGRWRIPRIEVGDSAVATFHLYAQELPPSALYAEVAYADQRDPDSRPSNRFQGGFYPTAQTIAIEDDEAFAGPGVARRGIDLAAEIAAVRQPRGGRGVLDSLLPGDIVHYALYVRALNAATPPTSLRVAFVRTGFGSPEDAPVVLGEVLSVPALQATEIYELAYDLMIPDTLPTGDYELRVRVDDENLIEEALEGNNADTHDMRVKNALAPALSDLRPELVDVSLEGEGGRRLAFEYSVANEGRAAAAGGFDIGYSVYRTIPTGPYYEREEVVVPTTTRRYGDDLGAGASTPPLTATLDLADLPDGAYTLRVVTDAGAEHIEVYEGSLVEHDFRLSTPEAPDPGSQVDLSLAVTQPPSPPRYSSYATVIALRNDGSAPAGEVVVWALPVEGSVLEGGNEYSLSAGEFYGGYWTLPGLAPGEEATLTFNYFLLDPEAAPQYAQVWRQEGPDDRDSSPRNGAGAVNEDDEARSDLGTGGTGYGAGLTPPNFRVAFRSVPTGPHLPGDELSVTVRVDNDGEVAAPAGAAVEISARIAGEATPFASATTTIDADLAPAGSFNSPPLRLIIPTEAAAAGEVLISAVVDPDDVVTEGHEDDNRVETVLTVEAWAEAPPVSGCYDEVVAATIQPEAGVTRTDRARFAEAIIDNGRISVVASQREVFGDFDSTLQRDYLLRTDLGLDTLTVEPVGRPAPGSIISEVDVLGRRELLITYSPTSGAGVVTDTVAPPLSSLLPHPQGERYELSTLTVDRSEVFGSRQFVTGAARYFGPASHHSLLVPFVLEVSAERTPPRLTLLDTLARRVSGASYDQFESYVFPPAPGTDRFALMARYRPSGAGNFEVRVVGLDEERQVTFARHAEEEAADLAYGGLYHAGDIYYLVAQGSFSPLVTSLDPMTGRQIGSWRLPSLAPEGYGYSPRSAVVPASDTAGGLLLHLPGFGDEEQAEWVVRFVNGRPAWKHRVPTELGGSTDYLTLVGQRPDGSLLFAARTAGVDGPRYALRTAPSDMTGDERCDDAPQASRPNLQILSATASVAATPGDTLALTFAVVNEGPGVALRSRVGIDVPSDLAGTRGFVASAPVDTLLPGDTAVVTLSVPVVFEAPVGTFALAAVADDLNELRETDEDDNTAVFEVVIALPTPNLAALELSVDSLYGDDARRGQLSLDVRVERYIRETSGYRYRLLISEDTIPDAADRELSTYRRSGPILAGAYEHTREFDLRYRSGGGYDPVPAGDYHLIAVLDPDERVTETDETDNIATVPLVVGSPDEFDPPTDGGGGGVPAEGVDLELRISGPAELPPAYSLTEVTFVLANAGTEQATGIEVAVPRPSNVVYEGGNEYVATAGTLRTWGDNVWTVGALAAGDSALLTVRYYTLGEGPHAQYAEVLAQNEPDLDSAPGNGDGSAAREDDEATLAIGRERDSGVFGGSGSPGQGGGDGDDSTDEADVSLSLTAAFDVEDGEPTGVCGIRFEVELANAGPDEVTGVEVAWADPEGLAPAYDPTDLPGLRRLAAGRYAVNRLPAGRSLRFTLDYTRRSEAVDTFRIAGAGTDTAVAVPQLAYAAFARDYSVDFYVYDFDTLSREVVLNEEITSGVNVQGSPYASCGWSASVVYYITGEEVADLAAYLAEGSHQPLTERLVGYSPPFHYGGSGLTTITLPHDLAPGRYRVWARISPADPSAPTVNPSNDARYVTVELPAAPEPPEVPDGPDLELSIASARDNHPAWQFNEVTFTLVNAGTETATGITVAVPRPPEVVYEGGNEYVATAGRLSTWGDNVWTVGTLAAGESAELTVSYYALVDAGYEQWAEVLAQNERDVDSAPGNGAAPTASEDDEARLQVRGRAGVAGLHITPTSLPQGDIVTVSLTDVTTGGKADLIATDVSGRVVLRHKLAVMTGDNAVDLRVDGLSPGVYFVALPSTGAAPVRLAVW